MLEDLGNLGDFLGGIGVVITLVYLAFQIRLNTNNVRIATAASWANQRTQTNAFIAQTPEINRIFWAGLEDPESLSREEWHHFESIFSTWINSFEAGFNLRRQSAISAPEWEAQLAAIEWMVTMPGFKRYWQTWGASYSADYGRVVTDLLRKVEAA